MPVTPDRATRRFVGLTALRWLPNGLATPVVVLLASSRGLSLPEIGVIFIVHGLVVTALELPTGGLADVLGARTVLALSALVQVAALLALVAAGNVWTFALGFGLVGVARALDSGPLEAWYVDAVHLASPGADVTRGLSLAGVADGLALAGGAVLGGALPSLLGGSSRALVAPLVVAIVVDLIYLVAVLGLVTPLRRPFDPSPQVRFGTTVRQVPLLVRSALLLARQDKTVRLLFGISFSMGAVFYTLEVLGPLHFSALAGDTTSGSAVFGVVVALSFVSAAAGSALAATARRGAGGSDRWAIALLFVFGALLLVALALAGTTALAAMAYCAFYLTNSATGPLRRQLLHARVPSTVRSSALSSLSLCLQAGGIGAGLVVPALAERAGRPVAFLAMAAVVVLAGGLALRLPTIELPAAADA